MEDYDKIINILERMRETIMEVQIKFSEAAEIFSRNQAYDLTQLPETLEIINYLNQEDQRGQTEYDKLLKIGDSIKNVITNAQARFLHATKIINSKPGYAITNEQLRKFQEEINEATIDIVTYNELVRRLSVSIGIPIDSFKADHIGK